MSKGKNVLLGITGGIAAYKMPDLVRLLRGKNVDVRVAMTKNAERFVTPLTLSVVSEQPVITADRDFLENPMEHLDASRLADLALIAPATANFVGKLAGGIADDMLSTLALGLKCPLFVSPSMNPRMYSNSAVQENLETLKRRGIRIIDPDKGETACGEIGEGRLPAIDRLSSIVEKELGLRRNLKGLKLLITAGRTEEAIDSARFISNRSSGKMGIAVAVAACERGADVTLVHGPLSEPLPDMTKNIFVRSAREMRTALLRHFCDCDILIMAAAVSDYEPAHIHNGKIKKSGGKINLPLVPTPDILEELGKMKGRQTLVGFAAETENFLANAREKLIRKNADLICVNDVSRSDIAFDSDYNQMDIIKRGGEVLHTPRLPKREIAHLILDSALSMRGQKELKVASSSNG